MKRIVAHNHRRWMRRDRNLPIPKIWRTRSTTKTSTLETASSDADRINWGNATRPACRYETSDRGDSDEKHRDTEKRRGVCRCDSDENRAQRTPREEGADESKQETDRELHGTSSHNQPENPLGGCSERHAHSELLRALTYSVSHDRVDSHRGDDQCQKCEYGEEAPETNRSDRCCASASSNVWTKKTG